MKPMAILDTGPLVAFLDSRDQHHEWAIEAFRSTNGPLWTCEAVVTEACFLLKHRPRAVEWLQGAIQSGSLRIVFRLENHAPMLFSLLKQYAQLPMSFADACLVCLAAEYHSYPIMTLDNDFQIYRLPGGAPISVITRDY